MKIIDLAIYRSKKLSEHLEKRISEIATTHVVGGAREIKICFKQWLKLKSSSI
jgi:hypothetical protein